MRRSIVVVLVFSIATVIGAGCASTGSSASSDDVQSQTVDAASAVSVDTGALSVWMNNYEPDAENYLDIPDTVLRRWPRVGHQACLDVGHSLRSMQESIPPIPNASLEVRFQAAVEKMTSDVAACGAREAKRTKAELLQGDADTINRVLVDTLAASKY